MNEEYDVVIVGGGMVGASLACCLANQPVRVAIIEAVPVKSSDQPSYDERGLALSLSSQRILQSIAVWPQLQSKPVPVEHVHVSDQGHFGFARLHASNLNLSALGYIVTARALGGALMQRINTADNIDMLCPATVTEIVNSDRGVNIDVATTDKPVSMRCRLLVVADGTHSSLRGQVGITATIKDYKQTAIVTNISTEKNHDNTAYERFTASGPIAFLPLSDKQCVSVFTVPTSQKQKFFHLSEIDYLQVLEKQFGRRLGHLLKAGQSKTYPIVQLNVDKQFSERVVLLGNSAHTLHPNGAQGFNLALRDAAALAETLLDGVKSGEDLGSHSILNAYVEVRKDDQQRVMKFTDRTAQFFYNNHPVKVITRNLAMLLMDIIPGWKESFTLQAVGIHGRQPRNVRGLSL